MATTAHRIGMGAALLLVASTLSGCVIGNSARFKETRSVLAQHDDAAPISVVTSNGSVAIRKAATEPVRIEATIRAQSRERLEEVAIVASTLDDGTLDVRVEWPGGKRRNNEGVSFDIRVPGAEGVHVDTGNGRIEIADLAGSADLRTSNGRIVVSNHVGPILADTSNGRIEIVGATESVDVRTSNGGVAVSLTPDNPGPVQIDTSNGGVSLRVGAAFNGRLVLSTSNGRVRLENAPSARIRTVGRDFADIVIGDESQRSRVDTSNGGITVDFNG